MVAGYAVQIEDRYTTSENCSRAPQEKLMILSFELCSFFLPQHIAHIIFGLPVSVSFIRLTAFEKQRLGFYSPFYPCDYSSAWYIAAVDIYYPGYMYTISSTAFTCLLQLMVSHT